MMKMIKEISQVKFFAWLLFSAISVSTTLAADAQNGKKLYESNNCGSCHAFNKKIIGPALAGVNDRHSEEWLIQWIRNNKKLRETGDAEALKLYAEYNSSPMNVYENLSADDVKDILAYIKLDATPKEEGVTTYKEEPQEESQSVSYLTFLVIVFFILFLVLTRVRSRLRRIAPTEENLD
jgi:cytochrome c2